MSGLSEKEIAKGLQRVQPEPPAGLVETLKAQIPADVFPNESDEAADRGARLWYREPWLQAAASVVLLGGAFLITRPLSQGPEALDQRPQQSIEQVERRTEGLDEGLRLPVARIVTLDSQPSSASEMVDRVGNVAEVRAPSRPPIESSLGVRQRETKTFETPQVDDLVVATQVDALLRGNVAIAEGTAQRLVTPAASVTESVRGSAIIAGSNAAIDSKYEVFGAEYQRQKRPRVLDGIELRRRGQFRALGGARLARADVTPRNIIRLPPGSTGGTAEPNDQAYGDTFFQSAGVNPFIDTDDDALSTFGLDVDTASYTVARSYLENGQLPPKEAVRVEEFLNFFDYGDRPPRRGDFALSAEGGPSPFGEGPLYRLLRFSIVGREIPLAERKPAVLTFLVDVSGSMERQNRLGAVQHALSRLLDQLTPADRVGLVAYGNTARVLVEPTSDHQAISRAVWELRPGGSTNLDHGLARAYDLAIRYRRSDAINRIILCSDGVANVGRTGAASLLASVGEGLRKGIEISVIGFGMGNYNDVLLERLADQGNGNYYYVDSREEAERVFVENLTGTLQTIAADAKVQVEFNPDTVSRYRLLGYENRDVADRDFRNDSVDAGEIGAGHRITALYEIKLQPNVGRRADLATLRLRYQSKAEGRVLEHKLPVSMTAIASSWERSAPSLQLASVVAEFAEILKGSYWAREGSLFSVMEQSLAMKLDSVPGRKDRVAELLTMVRSANELRAQIDSHNAQVEELERQKRELEERGSSTEDEDLEELRRVREQLRRDLESTKPVGRD